MEIVITQPGIIQGNTVLGVNMVVDLPEPRAQHLIKSGLAKAYIETEIETATAEPVMETPEKPKRTNRRRKKDTRSPYDFSTSE